jgi:UDP-2,4-diacetamido-2,4,6-trideoxy-beta-L-altropyranose hydrolase
MAATTADNLIVRADASSQIGIGHIMRCLVLAQAWQSERGPAVILGYCENDFLPARMESLGIRLIRLEQSHPDPSDLDQTLMLLRDSPGSRLLLDGYHFDPAYQQAVRRAGGWLCLIDDNAHWSQYHAHILINQNIHAEQLAYHHCDPDTVLLRGTRYVLLRPEFLAWRRWSREISDTARRILVTLGGSDPGNVTLQVIRGLERVDILGLEVKIIVGPSNPHAAALDKAIEKRDVFQLLTHVSDMPRLMSWADLAISGGGSTCWELAFMRLPSVLLSLAENQRAIAAEMGRLGFAVNLGASDQVSPEQIAQVVTHLLLSGQTRADLSRRGLDLVDGEGADRVLMWMSGEKVRLRRVREEDGRLLWEWANDPAVRAVSFSSEPISWQQHWQWFNSKLSSPDCIFYIAVNLADLPIGQVRFERTGDEATISVSLAANFRGKGFGSSIIRRACRKLLGIWNVKRIHAYVKTKNQVSLNAFSRAGFKMIGTAVMKEQRSMHLILINEDTE